MATCVCSRSFGHRPKQSNLENWIHLERRSVPILSTKFNLPIADSAITDQIIGCGRYIRPQNIRCDWSPIIDFWLIYRANICETIVLNAHFCLFTWQIMCVVSQNPFPSLLAHRSVVFSGLSTTVCLDSVGHCCGAGGPVRRTTGGRSARGGEEAGVRVKGHQEAPWSNPWWGDRDPVLHCQRQECCGTMGPGVKIQSVLLIKGTVP